MSAPVRIPPWALLVVAVIALSLLVGFDRSGLLRNTALLVASVLAIALPIGTLLAIFLARTDLPARRWLNWLLAVMLFVPLYLQAAGWMAGFGLQGWFSLAHLGPVAVIGWRGAIWVHAVAAIPWVVLIVGIGLWWVEPELEEQALLDAGPATVLARVTLRRSAGAILAAALWVAVTTAGEMTITDLFQIRTYAEELYTQIRLGAQPDELTISAAPGVLLIIVLLVGAAYCGWRLAPPVRSPSARPMMTLPLGSWKFWAAAAVVLLLLFLGGVPLGNLIYKAGVVVTSDEAGFHRSWSPVKCVRIVATSPLRNWSEFRWSLVLSALAATSGLALGLMLAWWGRKTGPGAWLGLLVMAVCLATPGPALGLAIIWLMNRREIPTLVWLYDDSLAAPWLALTVRVLPLSVLVLWHALRSIPEETLEAAQSEGATAWTSFWRIALPQRKAALALAWLVAFAVAMGDLSATILVVPPGVMTLSNLLFDKLHGAQEDDVAGISLALLLFLGTIALAIRWLAVRWQSSIDSGPATRQNRP